MLGKIPRRKLFSLPVIAGSLLALKSTAIGETNGIDDSEKIAGCAICQVIDHKSKFIIRKGKAYHKHCLNNPPKYFNHHYANTTKRTTPD